MFGYAFGEKVARGPSSGTGRHGCEWPSPKCPRERRYFRTCLSVRVFIHSDQVALHSTAAILQHSAELFPVIEDEEVDVQFRWSSLVICNLSGAIRVHGRLA